jgi:hypothetical protein
MTHYGFRFVALTLILSVVLPAAFGLQSPPDPPATDPRTSPDPNAPLDPPSADAATPPESKPLPESAAPALPPADPVAVTPRLDNPNSTPAAAKLGERLLPDSTDPLAENGREIRNKHLIIAWSEGGDELRGFSTKLGDWDLLKIDAQLDITPTIGTQVAAVRVGNKLAAFSAEKGWWDVVTLSKDWTGEFQASDEVVTTRDNGHLYTFAAQKGRWTSPTDSEYQKQRQQIAANVFPGSNPQFFQNWIESLPRYEARGVTAQFGRSGLEVETDRRSLMSRAKAELESKLNHEAPVPGAAIRFPGPPVTSVRSYSATPGAAIAATPAVPGVGGVATTLPPATFFPADPNVVTTVPGMPIAPRIAIARDPQIQQLRSELDAINAEVEQMASQSESESLPEEALRPFVEKSFDLRQDLQQLEAQRLRTKLQEIEKALEERQQNRDKLIEQRVKELKTSGMRVGLFQAVPAPRKVIGKQAPNSRVVVGQLLPTKPTLLSPTEEPATSQGSVSPRPTAATLAQRLAVARNSIEYFADEEQRLKKNLDDLKARQPKISDDSIQRPEKGLLNLQKVIENNRVSAHAGWQVAWSEYQSEIKNLESAIAVIREQRDRQRKELETLSKAVLETNTDVDRTKKDAQAIVEAADASLKQAEEVLKEYREIETKYPELNPEARTEPKTEP